MNLLLTFQKWTSFCDFSQDVSSSQDSIEWENSDDETDRTITEDVKKLASEVPSHKTPIKLHNTSEMQSNSPIIKATLGQFNEKNCKSIPYQPNCISSPEANYSKSPVLKSKRRKIEEVNLKKNKQHINNSTLSGKYLHSRHRATTYVIF